MSQGRHHRPAGGAQTSVRTTGPARACLGCVVVFLVAAGLALALGWGPLSGFANGADHHDAGDATKNGGGETFGAVRAWFERLAGVEPPWPEADRWLLVRLAADASASGKAENSAAMPASLLPIWRAQALSVDAWLARSEFDVTLDVGAATSVRAALVAPGWFEVLGVEPLLGRGFVPADLSSDDGFGEGEGRVILSSSAWQDLLAGTPDSIGRTLRIDGSPAVVVGVLPAGIEDALPVQLWIAGWPEDSSGAGSLVVLARLRDGVGQHIAEAELAEIARGAGVTGGVRADPVSGS